jgi:hypothetical protein
MPKIVQVQLFLSEASRDGKIFTWTQKRRTNEQCHKQCDANEEWQQKHLCVFKMVFGPSVEEKKDKLHPVDVCV